MKVQVSDIKFKSVLWGFNTGMCTDLIKNGSENLLFTGAKGYYLGGGWWRISGYAANGKDVFEVMAKLKG